MEEAKKGRCSAGPLTFAVRHELWLRLEPTLNLGAAS